MKQAKPFLQHIMDEINYLLSHSEELTFENFIADETLKRSFVRSFEIIGEAAKNISKSFKSSHPEIPWKEMAGMRDVLVHQYFGINYKSVWDIMKNKIPKLKAQIENLLTKTNGDQIEEVNETKI